MKTQTTIRTIKINYQNIIEVGYCGLQTLLRFKEPRYYCAGVYGWNCDIYEVSEDTVIVTGYRPFGNIDAGYETTKKYERKAQELFKKSIIETPDIALTGALKELINNFVEEVKNAS